MNNKYVMTETKHMSVFCHAKSTSPFCPSELFYWEGTKCTLSSELILYVFCIVFYMYKL